MWTTWTEIFLALKHRARELRGGATHEDERWPLTTTADVVAIVALVHPIACATELPPLTEQRWSRAMDELVDHGFATSAALYAHNRSFWSALARLCVDLEEIDAPLPDPAVCELVLDELGAITVEAQRNANAPHSPAMRTYDQLWQTQRDGLATLRGFDAPAPGESVPRTTNGDVVQLATYWTDALARARGVGLDGAIATWKLALTDIEQLAKPGKPDEVYAKNRELWQVMCHVAEQLASTSTVPRPWPMIGNAIEPNVAASDDHAVQASTSIADRARGLAGNVVHALGAAASAVAASLRGVSLPVLLGAGGIAWLLLRHPAREVTP